MHIKDSGYDDVPWERYQFPKSYLERAREIEGGKVIYYEPGRNARTYFATARVKEIKPDKTAPGKFIAWIDTKSYKSFVNRVPYRVEGKLMEQSLADPDGQPNKGRRVWSIRPIPKTDFDRIYNYGMNSDNLILPRSDEFVKDHLYQEQEPFHGTQNRSKSTREVTKWDRDPKFRTKILRAYGRKCAFTSLNFENEKGHAEVEAAHIKPVPKGGPDTEENGIALTSTCLLYTSPSPRDKRQSRMPSSA